MTEPSGARLPVGKQTVAVRPRARARSGEMMTSSGSMPSRVRRRWLRTAAALALLPPVEVVVEGFAGDGEDGGVEEAGAAEVEHDLGDASGEEDLHGGEAAGAVGEGVDEARDFAVDRGPVGGGGAAEAGGVGDGRDVEQEVGRAAEGCVEDHGVADGGVGEDVAGADAELGQAQEGAGGAGWRRRARWAGRRARARRAGATGRGLRRRPARWRRCRGTGSRRRGWRRRGSPSRRRIRG